MILTKKKAIKITVELWEWLAETGKEKGDWDKWAEYGYFLLSNCPLCEYTQRNFSNWCEPCPLKIVLGSNCYGLGYDKWEEADVDSNVEGRKKYAKLFLEELRRL